MRPSETLIYCCSHDLIRELLHYFPYSLKCAIEIGDRNINSFSVNNAMPVAKEICINIVCLGLISFLVDRDFIK